MYKRFWKRFCSGALRGLLHIGVVKMRDLMFIRLTQGFNNSSIYINVEKILFFFPQCGDKGSVIHVTDDSIEVNESPEIIAKIMSDFKS